MKNIFKYCFIGIIQGLTEFLPVSSSGHIVLFGSIFDMDNLLLLSIVAHIGTLFAVIFCYRKKLITLVRHPKDKTNINLLLATIPTLIIVLLFNKFFESSFKQSTIIWGFLISAVLLILADLKKERHNHFDKKSSFFMGIVQGLAVLPGISRSGSTLVAGLLLNKDRQETVEFSFLMSIPIIIGSAIYESFSLFNCCVDVDWVGIIITMLVSFIFGILSIKLMLKIINQNKLYYFSIYLIAISLVALLI